MILTPGLSTVSRHVPAITWAEPRFECAAPTLDMLPPIIDNTNEPETEPLPLLRLTPSKLDFHWTPPGDFPSKFSPLNCKMKLEDEFELIRELSAIEY